MAGPWEKYGQATTAADSGDFTDRYNTSLSPQEEQRFQAWTQSLGPRGSTYDYDLRGAFKAGVAQSANGHFPDTYKKPNHPTFSTDSKYSGIDGFQGGAWSKKPDKTWSFSPSPSILKIHPAGELQSYFQRVEPGNSLVLPSQASEQGAGFGSQAGRSAQAPWQKYANSRPGAAPESSVPAQPTKPSHAAAVAGFFARHPFSSMVGLAENALSGVTGGVGSVAEAVTGSDPGSIDLAYRPRTSAGQDIARLGGDEAQVIGDVYDRYAGTGPLAQTIKERGPQALNAAGTVAGLGSIPKLQTALRGSRVAPRVPEAAQARAPMPEPAYATADAGTLDLSLQPDAGRRYQPQPSAAAPAAADLELHPAQGRNYPNELPGGNMRQHKKPQPPTPEETRARDYVARSTGLDWDSLSASVQQRLTYIAKDAESLGKLDSKALERQARLESLPVPIKATKGQLTRDTAQLNNEGTLAATEAGRPIKSVRDAQSGAIVQNLEVLKGKVRGRGATQSRAESPEQLGRSVQDEALRKKALLSKKSYDDLYATARKTEPDAAVSPEPIFDLLNGNPEIQHLGFVKGWLQKANIETVEGRGGAQVKTRRPVKLAELEDLRQKASGIAAAGGTDGYYAGRVVSAIDQSRRAIPESARAWRNAETAFSKHKREFSDQLAVERLVENRTRSDRSVALEDTWRKTVLDGSIEDLNKVKRSLLTGDSKETRIAGRRAWRDMRAQTLQHIIDESTKISAPLPDGTPAVSAAGMQKAIRGIGVEKLDSIFGQGTTRELNEILRATKEVRTEPPRIHPGASTWGNAVAFLEKALGKLPGGDIVTGTVRTVAKAKEIGKTGRELREAQQTPLGELPRNVLNKSQRQNAFRDSTRNELNR